MFAVANVAITEKFIQSKTFSLVHGSRIFEVQKTDNDEISIRTSIPDVKKIKMPTEIMTALNGENIVSVAESKGALIVELRSPRKLFNLKPNIDFLKYSEYSVVILTTDAHYEVDVRYDFCARVLAPKIGIFEDSVAPLVHSRLFSYWRERINKDQMIGYQKTRGESYIKINSIGDFLYITGKSICVAKGLLFLEQKMIQYAA
jgi:predicted PhzF superfamily epimerase YddE/YHI9